MSTRRFEQNAVDSSRIFGRNYPQGDCLRLRAQQRVPLPPLDNLIVLQEGMLAIDAMPAKGKLQVLDFLTAGDVLSPSSIMSTARLSLRAITSTALVTLQIPEI